MRPSVESTQVAQAHAELQQTCSPRLPLRSLFANYAFAALAGIMFYGQFLFYSMGHTQMGRYGFSSWILHMASIIIFATLWGLLAGEWRGTHARTRMLVAAGLTLLVGSTAIVGDGNYLKSRDVVPVLESLPIVNATATAAIPPARDGDAKVGLP